ncbi:hypothetical protein [Acidovorax carolinensis]|nr:hypothetical protein [Acidovorax carolinensis]
MNTPNEQKFYDAKIKRLDFDAKVTVVEKADGEVVEFPMVFTMHEEGARGVLTIQEGGNFLFWPYVEQRLRRWPEEDFPGDEAKGYEPFWCWRLEGSDERIACKPEFVPGREGKFIEDNTEVVDLPVPDEFTALCASRGLTPEQVLRGFIADVCGLQNFSVMPREDGYSSNGSDERMYAEQWFERAYPKFDF